MNDRQRILRQIKAHHPELQNNTWHGAIYEAWSREYYDIVKQLLTHESKRKKPNKYPFITLFRYHLTRRVVKDLSVLKLILSILTVEDCALAGLYPLYPAQE